MATLTITKKSVCAGGGHFTLTFAVDSPAYTIDIDTGRDELQKLNVNAESIELTFKMLLAILARIYTPSQLAQKINAGMSITL